MKKAVVFFALMISFSVNAETITFSPAVFAEQEDKATEAPVEKKAEGASTEKSAEVKEGEEKDTPKADDKSKDAPPPVAAKPKYNCAKKYCKDMSSCEEAYYKLNTCGHKRLDRDKDGVPCESICGGG